VLQLFVCVCTCVCVRTFACVCVRACACVRVWNKCVSPIPNRQICRKFAYDIGYRVAKPHRIPYLYRSFSSKVTCI